MKTPSPPFLHRLMPVARQIILDFLPPHESRQNGLVNGIIF